ncbi:MAG: AAA domain-containing protein [Dehalococcoidia bacterium]|nr:AAA domain-containing protein [Dehalococcoidia bacterium]
MAAIIAEFIQALDEEIEAVKKGRGGSTVKVFNGRFLREVSGLFVYVFNLENFLAVLDESPAEIEIKGHSYSAQVLLTQGLEVEIGIQQFCGQYIPEARLQTNLWYLLELLKNKYAECQSGSAKSDFHLSEVLFSGQPAGAMPFNRSELHYSPSGNSPNPAQRQAIEASFSSQLCVIWGPPGTGKTETIAKAIEAHLTAGRRVLLVSHANNAVDEALEDVAGQLKDTPFYQEGKLVRLGRPQPEHLTKLETDYPLVLLDKIALKLGESLVSEKNALETENARLAEVLTQFETAFSGLQKVRMLSSELDNLQAAISESTRRLAIARHDLTQLEEVQRKTREELVEAQSAGALKRIFRRLDPQKIQRDIDQTSIAVDSKKRLVEQIGARLNELANSNDTKEREANEAKAEFESLLKLLGVSSAGLETKRAGLDQRKNTILSRIAEINRQLDETQKKVLSEARLVATTLTKTCVAKQFPEVPFDVLILDEASMAPLPCLYWAASRCREFITIVGDFLQLPPICIAEKPMAQKWLGRSIFDVLGINSVPGATSDTRVKLLDTQYRMAPEISAIPNSLFYYGRLKDDPSTFARKLDDGVSDSPLVLVETSAMNPWCSQLSAGSRFNLYHALVCATLARRIIGRIPDGKIGIVTPYAPQARLINKIARDWELLDRVRISTVHRFQGGEEPIIIFDSCEAPGLRVAPMLDDTKKGSDARLVLNVATTRARNRLYFVGHTKHLLAGVHRDSALARIIHHFYERAEVLVSETLVDSYFTTDFEKWAEALLPSMVSTREPVSGDLYTERNFWPQFFQDVKTTKERLIILSPFITVNRSGRLMELFRAMIGRGIEIRVYTRPVNQQTGEMANQADIVIKQLRSIGVKVIERLNMHQKVAIIDSAFAWEGSLNILSHRDTGEQMRRFEGPSAIEEIIKNLELDEDMPVGSQTEEGCPEPGCDGFLVVRVHRPSGRRFLGCSNYAKGTCHYTRPLGKLTGAKDSEAARGKS